MLSTTVRRGARRAKTAGRRAARSGFLRVLARAGFAARGVLYILIGWIALQIAFGHAGRPADSSGALQTVRSTSVGSLALWLLAIGFIGLALWRLAQAVYGGPGPGERKPSARVLALAKAALYGILAFVTLRYAVGSAAPKSSDRQSTDLTASLMRHPGGPAVVVIAGLILIAGGCYLIWTAWRKTFLRDLVTARMSRRQRRVATWFGEAGGIARGLVFAAAGAFLVAAGAEHSPGRAKGVDSTLRAFAHTPAGPWLLALVAVGLILFGVYSCLEARWRRI